MIGFQVIKGHPVLLADRLIARYSLGLPGPGPDPGALNDLDVLHAVGAQVLDGPGQHAGVGGRPPLRRGSHHQVGLEGHPSSGGDALCHIGGLH